MSYRDNNWKTTNECKKESIEAEEKIKDTTTKVKLRFSLGEIKGKIKID